MKYFVAANTPYMVPVEHTGTFSAFTLKKEKRPNPPTILDAKLRETKLYKIGGHRTGNVVLSGHGKGRARTGDVASPRKCKTLSPTGEPSLS